MSSFFEGLLENATDCICCDTYIAKDSNQLTIHFGDFIHIIERTTNDWWYAECNGEYGYVPTNYTKLCLDHYIDKHNTQTRIAMQTKPDQHKEEIACCLLDTIEKDLLQDPDYFEGYNSIKIHHEMLTDSARTKAYQNAVRSLSPYIKDKIVLDVGCGTGILSIFCANAGAKHVYAVEASAFAFKTRKIIEANNLTGKISVLHGKIEDIFLPVEKVDVIISEWMGTMLVTESMICSILFARDKYLRGFVKDNLNKMDSSFTENEDEIIIMDEEEQKVTDDVLNKAVALHPPPLPQHLMDGVIADRGLMMPSCCNLYLGPIDLSDHIEEKINYFNDVYGANMEPLKEDATELYLAHATYEVEIDAKNMLCEKGIMIKHYNMYQCNDTDLESLDVEFKFVMDKNGLFCGFAGWFDVIFNPLHDKESKEQEAVVLDTSPFSKRTHWSQTLFPLSQQIKVNKGDVVTGKLSFFRNNVSIRDYRMFIECTLKDKVYRKMFFVWD